MVRWVSRTIGVMYLVESERGSFQRPSVGGKEQSGWISFLDWEPVRWQDRKGENESREGAIRRCRLYARATIQPRACLEAVSAVMTPADLTVDADMHAFHLLGTQCKPVQACLAAVAAKSRRVGRSESIDHLHSAPTSPDTWVCFPSRERGKRRTTHQETSMFLLMRFGQDGGLAGDEGQDDGHGCDWERKGLLQ